MIDENYVPKTELGKKLWKLRLQIKQARKESIVKDLTEKFGNKEMPDDEFLPKLAEFILKYAEDYEEEAKK